MEVIMKLDFQIDKALFLDMFAMFLLYFITLFVVAYAIKILRNQV